MAWLEPLTVSSEDSVRDVTRRVTVQDGSRLPVLRVEYRYDRQSRSSILGEIILLESSGSARQRVRAFVLLIRECVSSALMLGMETYIADVHGHMRPITEAATGELPAPGQRSGSLLELLNDLAERTAEDGTIVLLAPEEEQRLTDIMDKRIPPDSTGEGGISMFARIRWFFDGIS